MSIARIFRGLYCHPQNRVLRRCPCSAPIVLAVHLIFSGVARFRPGAWPGVQKGQARRDDRPYRRTTLASSSACEKIEEISGLWGMVLPSIQITSIGFGDTSRIM